MPIPKSPQRRYAKWSSKYVPDTVSARFSQVETEAKERAQEGMIPYANLDFTIAPVLDKNGVAGPDRAKYLALARKVAREADRLTGRALDNVVLGLKSYFVTAYGLDPTIADEVIQAVIGYVPTY